MGYNINKIEILNITFSDIQLSDLSGLIVPASGTIDVTELFPFRRLCDSQDLDYQLTNSGVMLVINDGYITNEDARTYLNHKDATHIVGKPVDYSQPMTNTARYLKFLPDEDKFQIEGVSFFDLDDVLATTYSGSSDRAMYVSSTASGISFRPKYREDVYTEYTYDGLRIIQEDTWEDATKAKQIASKVIQRTDGLVTQVTKYVYDYDTGTEIVGTLVSTPTRSNNRVTSITKTKI